MEMISRRNAAKRGLMMILTRCYMEVQKGEANHL